MSPTVEDLFGEHGPALLGYLVRRVADPQDAADLLSETFLVAWRRRDELPPPPNDRLWLYTVARHTLANHRRSVRRRSAATAALARVVRTVTSDSPEMSWDVRRAIALLDDLDREIITLSTWEGLVSEEIATIVGLAPSTVRARLARTRAELAKAVAVIEP